MNANTENPSPNNASVLVDPDWYERTSDDQLRRALARDRPAMMALLTDVLGADEAEELAADLEAMPLDTALEACPPPDTSLPIVLLLPGIMGSHLQQPLPMRDRLWLDPWDLMFTDLRRKLSLADDGITDMNPKMRIQPDGVIEATYRKTRVRMRKNGFEVHEMDFDWRKPIAHSADLLHGRIELLAQANPDRSFAIVAHSMGGLVACKYSELHPEWETRIERAIFMGTPLRGSYAPIQTITGTYPVVVKMAKLSPENTLKEIRVMASTMPGLIDMLPDPLVFADAAHAYDRGRWPEPARPLAKWLKKSLDLKGEFAKSPIIDKLSVLACVDRCTVGNLEKTNPIHAAKPKAPGDGTVPARSAVPPNVPAFRVKNKHSNIPGERAAIDAAMDLIRTGTCSLPKVTPADLDPNRICREAPGTEAMEAIATEAVAAGVKERMALGTLTARDARWLMAPDADLPTDH